MTFLSPFAFQFVRKSKLEKFEGLNAKFLFLDHAKQFSKVESPALSRLDYTRFYLTVDS